MPDDATYVSEGMEQIGKEMMALPTKEQRLEFIYNRTREGGGFATFSYLMYVLSLNDRRDVFSLSFTKKASDDGIIPTLECQSLKINGEVKLNISISEMDDLCIHLHNELDEWVKENRWHVKDRFRASGGDGETYMIVSTGENSWGAVRESNGYVIVGSKAPYDSIDDFMSRHWGSSVKKIERTIQD